jgi:hypothetical protein
MTYKSVICYEHGLPKAPLLVTNFNERMVTKTTDGFYESVETWCPICSMQCDQKTNQAMNLLYQAHQAKNDEELYGEIMKMYKSLIGVTDVTQKDDIDE